MQTRAPMAIPAPAFSNCCACSRAMPLPRINTQSPNSGKLEPSSLCSRLSNISPWMLRGSRGRCRAFRWESRTSSQPPTCRPRTDHPSTGITFPAPMRGLSNGCAISARRFLAKLFRRNLPGVTPGRRSIHGIKSTRRAVRHPVPQQPSRRESFRWRWARKRWALSSDRLRSMVSSASNPVSARSLAPACTRLAHRSIMSDFSRAVLMTSPTHCPCLAAPVTAISTAGQSRHFRFPSNRDCRRWQRRASPSCVLQNGRRPNPNSNNYSMRRS